MGAVCCVSRFSVQPIGFNGFQTGFFIPLVTNLVIPVIMKYPFAVEIQHDI